MKLLEEIKNIPSAEKDLRSFGRVMGIAFGILSGVLFWRHRPSWPVFAGLSAFFFAFGFLFPRALKPVQTAWMTLALLMGWVMTRVILAIVFYLVITPIGLVIRLSGKDFMNRSFPGNEGSYWLDHAERVKEDYERQF